MMNGFNQNNGIHYFPDQDGNIKTQRPWLSSLFSSLYDFAMKCSVFPRKFNASYLLHFSILKKIFQNVHQKTVLEIATGSGNVVNFLTADNRYHGIDISEGLLRLALKKFKKHGFVSAKLYLADASHLPFPCKTFDVAFCNLAFNFIDDTDLFISELKRVLKPGAEFICSVPVPEKIKKGVKIRGVLYSEEKLKEKFEEHLFSFREIPEKNGAILYFTASI